MTVPEHRVAVVLTVSGPIAGWIEPRFCPPCNEEVAELARAFLHDAAAVAATLERVGDLGLSVSVLPTLRDIDTVDELSAAWRAGMLEQATATTALITKAGWLVEARS